MKFNKFIWETYINSSEGKKWSAFFKSLENAYKYPKKSDNEVSDCMRILSEQLDLPENNQAVLDTIEELKDAAEEGLISKRLTSVEDALSYWDDIGLLITDDESEDLFYLLEDIPRLSVALHCLHPKYFFPYYFYRDFNHLKKIFEEFGIFLPPVPRKSHTEDRYNYYWELCQSLHHFWDSLELPTEDIPVFLYIFAPKVVDFQKPGLEKLPPANRAWFIGGGINNNGDFSYLDQVISSSTTYWQGSKDTEVGDIIVMYCLSPRSYIHSIWRAIEPGSVEPFFSFYGTIRIGYPQLVKPITFNEMKNDSLLSSFPLVKGSMQGINGRNIPKVYFDRILEILEDKGTNLDKIPRLQNGEWQGVKINTERDVEINLLEPLLRDLGFSESDWSRQIKLKVGRMEKAIPDYLIYASKNLETKTVRASWVWVSNPT